VFCDHRKVEEQVEEVEVEVEVVEGVGVAVAGRQPPRRARPNPASWRG